MTVQSTTARADYQGNGATTQFAIPFYFLDPTHVEVLRTDSSTTPALVVTLALNSDYTVAGAGNQQGGALTTAVAPTATQTITVLRNVPQTQLTHYVPNDPFPAASHENALDQLTMAAQQMQEQVNRGLTLPAEDSSVVTPLPPAATRANKVLAFGPDGQPTVIVPASGSAADVMIQLAQPNGAGQVGFQQAAAGAGLRTQASKNGDVISARDFSGVVGDGVHDDTAGLQAFASYIVANKRAGYLPSGTYKISAPLNFPAGGSYSLRGENGGNTKIVQYANNVPILNMGSDLGAAACVNINVTDLELDFNTPQTSAYPNGVSILLNTSFFLNSFRRLRLSGWYGLRVKSGVTAPQNTVFDEIAGTAGIYGGLFDWTGTTSAGPNNVIGRVQVDARNAVGPLFNIKGVNFVIQSIEFLNCTNSPQLMVFQAGTDVVIHSMKMEVYSYTNPGSLFQISTNCNVRIEQFICYGTTGVFAPATGNFTLFVTDAGGQTGSFHIDFLSVIATTVGPNVYLIEGAVNPMRIAQLVTDGNPNWNLCNGSSSATPDTLQVGNWLLNSMSANLGDTNDVIALGGPNILNFETAFTAPRTVSLPGNSNNLHNGLYYEIRAYGAVNGANTLTIACNGTTKYTIAADKTVVRFVYRRAATAQAGWVMTKYETLP